MDKRKPHYLLDEIQSIVARNEMNAFTTTAIRNGQDMGLDDAMMLATIARMKSVMFYKSMTTHRDATLWQDVYHVPLSDGRTAYIKLTLQRGAVVIQFKGKED
jgi:motility quorum-sensing regulator/GCU-specific mRNA interferase toxin